MKIKLNVNGQEINAEAKRFAEDGSAEILVDGMSITIARTLEAAIQDAEEVLS